jgi:malic enzyme
VTVRALRPRRHQQSGKKLWVHTVTTVSTFPPEGLFTKDAATIARTLASRRVSPGGLPRMDEWDAFPRVAMAAGLKAQEQGVARLTRSADELLREAERVMRESREAVRLLMREGLIRTPPGP